MSAQDTLENRLEQIHCLVTALLLAEETSEHLTARVLSGAFWSVQTLIDQARDSFKEMLHERKPAATVILSDGDEPTDLQEESLDVIREVVKELEDTLICPRMLLKAVDQRNNAAASAAPEGES